MDSVEKAIGKSIYKKLTDYLHFYSLSCLYIKIDTPNFISGFSAEVFQHLSTRFSKALSGVYKKTSGRSHDCPDIFLNLKNLIL